MRWLVLVLLAWSASAQAQTVLDPPPGADAGARALYAGFVLANTPRVAALGSNGKLGWYAGGPSLEAARSRAIALCTEHGGTGCKPYAEDLAVVWPGREWQPPPVPGPLVDDWAYSFEPDKRFLWHGPAAARGVIVWAHGHASNRDSRNIQPPSVLRAFNNAGFDVIRFDRVTLSDTVDRASGWLREELPRLRASGYRLVVAAGHSAGAWDTLLMLEQPGLADTVLAFSPAAQGAGSSTNLSAQGDDLRAIVAAVPPSRTRLAMAQFADDPFMADMDQRTALLGRLRGRIGAVLVIDRPSGLHGHLASGESSFAQRFGACLLHFTVDPVPPTECPDGE